MKKNLMFILSLQVFIFGFSQSPTLVKDINTIHTSLGGVEEPTTFNGYVYFIQDDGINGSEVWRTDGSTTTMHTNIDNATYGDPFSLTVWNANLYFSTDISGVWKTDGTNISSFTSAKGTIIPAATKLYLHDGYSLKITDGASEALDLGTLPNAGAGGYQFTTLDDGLFYSGNNPAVYGTELIYEDGLVANPPVVIDIYPGTDGSFPGSFTVYNNKLHFFAVRYEPPFGTNNNGTSGFKSLFESDGTVIGTTSLVDFYYGGLQTRLASDIGMTVFDNKLFYYNITGPTNTYDNTVLTSYDGTTHTDIHTFTNSNYNSYFKFLFFETEINGVLYISATHNKTFSSWQTDGITVTASTLNLTSAQEFTVLNNEVLFTKNPLNSQDLFSMTLAGTETSLYDFSNSSGLSPSNFNTLGGNAFFIATDDVEGSQLWKTDGTAPNTSRITSNGYTSTNGSNPTNLIQQLGNLYFSGDNGVDGVQLYKTDGSEPNTVLTGDAVGKKGGVMFNGEYYYTLGNNFTDELWKTDGTTATQIFQVTNKISNLTVSGSNLFFVTTTTNEGEELWVSDGTVANKQVLDMAAGGTFNTYPQDLVDVDGTLYFTGIDLNKGTRGLWKSDGAFAGTSVVFSNDYDISELAKFEDKLYFAAGDFIKGIELKLFNTTDDSFIDFDLNQSGDSEPHSFQEMNGDLYFFTKSPSRALWKSDGTEEGTVIVYTLPNPDVYHPTAQPDYVFASSNTLYFHYYPGYGSQQWTYNGNSIGQLNNIYILSGTTIDNMVYFSLANDLNETDGTEAGTKLILTGGVNTLETASYNNELYFSYDDGVMGSELYKYKSSQQGFELTPSSDLIVTENTNIDLTLDWTAGNGAGRIVLISTVENMALPVDGETYSSNTTYGASALGASTNTFIIGNGSVVTTDVSALTYGTQYYISIIEYTEPTAGDFIYDRKNVLQKAYFAPKIDQTINLTTIPAKSYGDGSFLVEATSTSSQTVTFTIVSGPGTFSSNILTITGAGDIVFDANVVEDATYNGVTLQTAVAVAKVALTATPEDKTKTYGAANPLFTMSYDGFIGSEDETVLDAAPVPSTTAEVSSNVGLYDITLSTGNDNNYDITNVVGTLTVSKAALTANVNSASKTYGDANPSFTLSYSGFVNSEDESVIDTAPTISTTADETSSAGDSIITATGGADNNYEITSNDGVLTINKASLSAVINDQERQYGQQNADATFTYTGFVNNDTNTDIDSPPLTSTTATNNSNVGTYAITAGNTGSDNNYDISLPTSGTLTIIKADQTITLDAIADQDLVSTTQVFVNSTINSSLSVTYTVSGPATIDGNMITLDGTVGTVVVMANQAGDSNHNAATEVSTSFETVTSDICFNFEVILNGSTFNNCNGESEASIDIAVSGGDGNYTYSWSNDSDTEDLVNITAGTYTITVSDGNNCSATLATTITDPEAIETPVIQEDKSVPGTVKLFTSNSGLTHNWYKDDVLYITNTGELTLTEDGVYTVSLEDESGCMSSKSESYTYSTVGIGENLVNTNITVYPNPTNRILNIECMNLSLKEIQILDITGKVVFIAKTNGIYQYSINVEDLSKGMYILKIHTEKGFDNKSFIIE